MGAGCVECEKEESKQRNKNKKLVEDRLDIQKKTFLNEVGKSQKFFDSFKDSMTRQIANIKQLIGSEINAEPGTYLNNLEAEVRKLTALQKQLSSMPSDPPVGVILAEHEADLVDNYISRRSGLRNNLGRRIAIYAQKIEEVSKRHRTRNDHLIWLQEKFDSVEKVYRKKINALVELLIKQQQTFMAKVNTIAAENIDNLKTIFSNEVGDLTSKKVADDKSERSAKKLEHALQLVETCYQ